MSDQTSITVESNTPEEVAYKLMLKIVKTSSDEKKILSTYERCLNIVRGMPYSDLPPKR